MTTAPTSPDGLPTLVQQPDMWTIWFNRPQQHHRLDPADVAWLSDCFAALLASTNKPRALVFRSAGSPTFSSGYTLQAIVGQLDERFENMLDVLEQVPVLTIAGMQGNVYGGATDLALCCDIRLGVTGMQMFMPAARIGLHYYPHGMRRYLTRLGHTAASKLFLTGATIDAQEMLRIGFLTELVAPEALEEALTSVLNNLAKTDPVVVGSMKKSLFDMAQVSEQSIAAARDRYHQSLKSDTLKQRLKAMGKGS
jgi:enoyl-CoA hydratase/carnithine racemase